ncbi:MAG TPA: hypothetical protein VED18_05800, partial [Candidatus Sulfotelmatobacter sp.]|nr:hypothetical protein [Candidatus Sulfotelmatobacter sp.]
MFILRMICVFVRGLLTERGRLALENLALRQQLAVLKHANRRPKLRPRDRIFWVWLSRLWREWRSALIVVRPDTVIRWHREGVGDVANYSKLLAHRSRASGARRRGAPGSPRRIC